MPSKMLKQFPCRCRKCGKRRTLSMRPEHYYRESYAKCKACGGSLRVDWYRKGKEHKGNTCYCNGYWFPHRKGGGVWCVEHPTGPSEEEMRERYLR